MYDYGIGYDSLMYDLIAGISIGACIIYTIICLTNVLLLVSSFVSNAVLFIKAGDKPWKSLIPVYDMYTYFKLLKKPKYFIVYAVSLGAFLISFIVFMSIGVKLIAEFYISEGSVVAILIVSLIILASAIALIVMKVLFCVELAKGFGKGGGFAVGLFFLTLIFKMILAFGSSEYKYAEKTELPSGLTKKEYTKGYVECISGKKKGMKIEMEDGDIVVIGRDPNVANFVVDEAEADNKVSRRHCDIQYSGEQEVFYITDFSSNGTRFDNGRTLVHGVKTPVKRGTVINLPKDIRFYLH